MSNPTDQLPDGLSNWLQHSFDDWDASEPSAQLWEELDESIAVERVWNRVDQSLVVEEHLPDEWITSSHQNWNPVPETDGWSKLDDAISLEQVWMGLNQSLNHPVSTRVPFWKLIAASLVALFISQHLSDTPIVSSTIVFPTSYSTNLPVDIQEFAPTNNSTIQFNTNNQLKQVQPIKQQRLVTLDLTHPIDQANLVINNQQVHPELRVENQMEQPIVVVNDSIDDVVDRLIQRSWDHTLESVYMRDFELPNKPFHHWTVQFGTQLSILQERNPASFTSTVPHFGIAADLSYRHRLGPIQFIHALGVSQYSQGAGKYINGRYFTTNQRIDCFQLSSSIGYSYKRFTFYGGLLFSKMLSGLEKKENAVTQVYDFDKIQPGFTAGIDYRIVQFPASGKHISLGSQYQWLPSYTGQKTAFENIQGIRFQIKFSF